MKTAIKYIAGKLFGNDNRIMRSIERVDAGWEVDLARTCMGHHWRHTTILA
jgi:hypothetical protein